jgi:hypothetical protein
LETLTDTLINRVDSLLEADREPLLSTSPASVWISELAARNDALEQAVRGIEIEG